MHTPAKGKLLLSEPFMTDINFIRSVVLLVEHNQSGSVGFVLNQPIELNLQDAIKDFPLANPALYRGGPCESQTLHYIHTAGETLSGSTEISQGLWWGGDHEQMKELFRNGTLREYQFKFFVGYSGWGEEQLADEMEQKIWIVAPANKEYLFNTPAEALWRVVMKNLGHKYAIMSNAPLVPNWN